MDGRQRVALCVTCIVDQLMPEVGVSTVKVLRRAGYEVDFPAEQTCCGQPFFNSGFRQQAINLAKRTIEIFEEQETVVLPSGSCTTMIKVEYPHLLEEWPEWQQRAEMLAEKTYELSAFLVQKAGWLPEGSHPDGPEAGTPAPSPSGSSSLSEPVTYHDSCHMLRLLHLGQESRQLLTSAGWSLHEMDEPDRCCGFGGLFSLRLPEVSSAMTTEKVRQATESGARIVVTADPGCLMQMRSVAADGDLKFEHLATVLEEATR